jgi:integrase
MSDLLNLRVGDVSTKTESEKVVLKESKTGKINFFVVNREIHKSLSRYLDDNNGLSPNNYLFRSRKGGGKMRLDSVNRMVKKWCKDVGVKENVGCRTLRKTFGYHLYQSGVSVEVIQKRFNHSSSNITLRYIGIDEERVEDTLLSFNL